MGTEIGRGGHAIVYQAFNINTGDFVAVKRIPMISINDETVSQVQVCYNFYFPRIFSFNFFFLISILGYLITRSFVWHCMMVNVHYIPWHFASRQYFSSFSPPSCHHLPRVYPPSLLPSLPSFNLFKAEIELMKRLNHPNIVEYYDTIRTDEHLNIVLE